MKRTLATLVAAAAAFGINVASAAEPTARQVPDYTVFVDPPTGFVFVKLPAGWRFVAAIDAIEVARLPDSVVTAMLVPGDEAPSRLLAARPHPAVRR